MKKDNTGPTEGDKGSNIQLPTSAFACSISGGSLVLRAGHELLALLALLALRALSGGGDVDGNGGPHHKCCRWYICVRMYMVHMSVNIQTWMERVGPTRKVSCDISVVLV